MDNKAVLKMVKKVRPEMTRRRRLGLFAWHLRMAVTHLLSILRGR